MTPIHPSEPNCHLCPLLEVFPDLSAISLLPYLSPWNLNHLFSSCLSPETQFWMTLSCHFAQERERHCVASPLSMDPKDPFRAVTNHLLVELLKWQESSIFWIKKMLMKGSPSMMIIVSKRGKKGQGLEWWLNSARAQDLGSVPSTNMGTQNCQSLRLQMQRSQCPPLTSMGVGHSCGTHTYTQAKHSFT